METMLASEFHCSLISFHASIASLNSNDQLRRPGRRYRAVWRQTRSESVHNRQSSTVPPCQLCGREHQCLRVNRRIRRGPPSRMC